MKTQIAPSLYYKIIAEVFGDDQRPAYGQIATLAKEKQPTLRTLHLHYLKELGVIAFSTHLKSDKWQEIKYHPYLSGCYYDTSREIQFRFHAKGELIEPKNQRFKEFLDEMWLKIRSEVRTAYWLDAKRLPLDSELPEEIDIQKRAPNLGVVLCRPFKWDIYEIHLDEYRKGERSVHTLTKNRWQSQNVSILHGKS
ncbi:MAG: pyridoxamine 5'-phosphate oxidase family protein [Deltaproteobacteria bacterium]